MNKLRIRVVNAKNFIYRLIAAAMQVLVAKLCWNAVLVTLFNFPHIGYWQVWGLRLVWAGIFVLQYQPLTNK